MAADQPPVTSAASHDGTMNEARGDEWLALTKEDPVDPERRIVDAHHHLWSRADALVGGREYLWGDLLRDTRSGHNVTETVVVERGSRHRQDGPRDPHPIEETEFAAAQAAASDGSATRIAAIVAFADLTLGDAVEEVLQAHQIAGRGRLRGVRQLTAADPGITLGRDGPRSGLLGEEGFRKGLARLGEGGWSFDAMVFHPQLTELADAARAVGGTTFVVNHLGVPVHLGPYTDEDEIRSRWQDGMRQLASCSNMVVKIGGIGMDALFGTDWSVRERPASSDDVVGRWGDDIRWCIDTFGPSRCMFESNFPVDRQGLGYTVVWNAFQKIAQDYSNEEQDALFSETAIRVYRIGALEGDG
jgi:L-fuconolactonase